MTDDRWLTGVFENLEKSQSAFIDRAILKGAENLGKEQSKRIQQAQDEIDGRIWSPDKW